MAHTLNASQTAAAVALGLTVREVGPFRCVVVCPHCGGERTVRPELLRSWAKKGRVPGCEAVKRTNVGTECRRPTTEATHAD